MISGSCGRSEGGSSARVKSDTILGPSWEAKSRRARSSSERGASTSISGQDILTQLRFVLTLWLAWVKKEELTRTAGARRAGEQDLVDDVPVFFFCLFVRDALFEAAFLRVVDAVPFPWR